MFSDRKNKHSKVKKVLFVCHGNICRSPMAEFVMKHLVEEAHLSEYYYIESAATSTEEIGNEVYPSARRKLAEHGISCIRKDGATTEKRRLRTFRLACWYGRLESS